VAELFVSDLHLDAERPEATEQFLAFLAHEARAADTLYILGDLFEAWIGDDDPEPEKARVCSGLQALTSLGVACFVLHGNRDFLLGAGFCERTGCVLLPDPVVIELDGERVLLTHGDLLCTDDRAYQELRSLVRASAWQRRFLALPLAVRGQLAAHVRAGSRAHIARAVPNIMDVNEGAVAAAHRASGARRIIHGHTHRPGIHDRQVDGAAAQRLVLGAWYEEGSYLAHDSGGYALLSLSRGAPAAE